MTDSKIEAEALRDLIPPEDSHISVKTLGDLKVGDFVEGIGEVVKAEPGEAPVVQTKEGETVLDKRSLDYPVSVVKLPTIKIIDLKSNS